MGISASQARLLTITARLTSNEYESQQISNAKMRLATQSQQASSEYIAALDSKRLMFTTYDAHGEAVSEPLTANALYQYSDLKNQYAIVNSNGQMLLSGADAKNYESSRNLGEFLSRYGIEKIYKSESMESNAEILMSEEFQNYYAKWDEAINVVKNSTFSGSYYDEDGVEHVYNDVSSDRAYEIEKGVAQRDYNERLAEYDDAVIKYNAGVVIDVDSYLNLLTEAKSKYSNSLTYDNWLMSKAAYNADGSLTDTYSDMLKYYEVKDELFAEAESYGCSTLEDMYVYSDESKARWYTNLWYRLNGDSSDKSAQGLNKDNYTELDNKLATSSQWLQDALRQGLISIETSTYVETANFIPDLEKPLSVQLKGISWRSIMYTSCTDFKEEDDDAAIAKAEAEYQRKNNEITAKDTKYTNKIKTLDTEHNTLQTEYESVQSAMSKNIERSFKAFS